MSSVTLQPIGVMKSVFHFKNGTPRQSSLCNGARGVVTIDKSIFNNPEHSLEGLEQFSHAWIIFVFHKNNNLCTKAKVKPPRLNGQRVGVFSTRSPYRPSNIGLSLVKIEKIEGASVYVSGIDILDGSPVLDIKPYIPEYDKPKEELVPSVYDSNSDCHMTADVSNPVVNVRDSSVGGSLPDPDNRDSSMGSSLPDLNIRDSCVGSSFPDPNIIDSSVGSSLPDLNIRDSSVGSSLPEQISNVSISSGDTVQTRGVLPSDSSGTDETAEVNHVCDILQESMCTTYVLPQAVTIKETGHFCQVNTSLNDSCVPKKERKDAKLSLDSREYCDLEAQTTVAPWLLKPPVAKLDVIFTSQALEQLQGFRKQSTDVRYQFEMFSTPEEAEKSIADILREEPRSVYRRQQCQDSLYYFAVDVLHVTCWFDENVAQVVRIKPVASVPMLQPQTSS